MCYHLLSVELFVFDSVGCSSLQDLDDYQLLIVALLEFVDSRS